MLLITLINGVTAVEKWVFHVKPLENVQYRLFCLPYAGAGASLFSTWKNLREFGIEVCPIQLPGRENRFNEPSRNNIKSLVSDICTVIADYLDKPFAIFGHSLGGIIAYELTLEVYRRYQKKPNFVVLSASSIFTRKKDYIVSQLSDEKLMDYLKFIGGTPEILLTSRYFEKYSQVIRSDYKLLENYRFQLQKLPCKLVALASSQDKLVLLEDIEKMKYFASEFSMISVEGTHFFINQLTDEIQQIISENFDSSNSKKDSL